MCHGIEEKEDQEDNEENEETDADELEPRESVMDLLFSSMLLRKLDVLDEKVLHCQKDRVGSTV